MENQAEQNKVKSSKYVHVAFNKEYTDDFDKVKADNERFSKYVLKLVKTDLKARKDRLGMFTQ